MGNFINRLKNDKINNITLEQIYRFNTDRIKFKHNNESIRSVIELFKTNQCSCFTSYRYAFYVF